MLLVAMVSVSFVSCENEQPEGKKKEKSYSELIVGTWNLMSVELYMESEGQEATQKEDASKTGYTFVFDKNGEFTMDMGEVATIEYEIDGKYVVVEGVPFMEILKLNEKDLSLMLDLSEDVTMKYTYNFVRAAE